MSVLAMYDIRGIQDYIFKTPKMRDAIGASRIVENIIERAFEESHEGYTIDLAWKDDGNPKVFSLKEAEQKDAEVLYIGGGNAYILFKNADVAKTISQNMSFYVLKETYSLQLAVAWVEKTANYAEDYKKLNLKMAEVKAKMPYTQPLCALPIEKIEIKTGNPVGAEGTSLETRKKTAAFDRSEDTRLSKYESPEEGDSTIAIVHIDGNNMGKRIKTLTEKITNYDEAVNKMREISFNISNSFNTVFNELKDKEKEDKEKEDKEKEYKDVLKIVVAGDDITYVCRAKQALQTVKYFTEGITEKTIDGTDNLKEYGFSVCAGVAYFHSHFPFSVAYQVAEACCASAKKRAKEEAQDNSTVGNFVDFQICKNIYAADLSKMREKEYKIFDGTILTKRPYDILNNLEDLFNDIKYFQKEDNIPRSMAKEIRNTYAMGKDAINILGSFMRSRKKKLPDGTYEFYEDDNIAKYYDALELMDDFDINEEEK